MNTSQLKQCPFCGDTNAWAIPNNRVIGRAYVIVCIECRVEGPSAWTEVVAAERWNTRASGWISVEERLPEPRKIVQVWGPSHTRPETATYSDVGKCWFYVRDTMLDEPEITCWAEMLPPPPEQK